MEQVIQFRAMGVVHNGIVESHRDTPWQEIESTVVLDEEWREALDGLEQFSHIWILFYFHKVSPLLGLKTNPMGRADLPLLGRFATRTPQRPNPIGMSPVELLEVNGTTLRVRGLEALEGTPVLDIKPYIARGDIIENTRAGEWVERYLGTKA
jgi:tRNA (adenine37-N6)-methyltransferase